ncbi:C4-dicarboxylate ABC transporter substrate-binding protein [Desulfuromonas versatilis]|uniref:C4-dicarboxylate ABC transporter substrate-binding protein n=1 Tax=Desulfuromonas versatilis TaxID=2802975 RepID=A0ABM8HYH8_9BACT|nr:TAXI family TRAP transporter solute-binding subunit [Desulfuromonas versatilis]BCR07049.1 C4-dicarboxylate ABC transporter substrate-binding protein [Desulfuromonas versatilis]
MPIKRVLLFPVSILILLSLTLSGCPQREPLLHIGGGPAGGTYQKVAAGLQEVMHLAAPGMRVSVERTGGSLANLKGVEQRSLDMAIVYAGDAYLAARGQLEKHLPPTREVRALTRIYGATAHLVVLANSRIRSVHDLQRKRVAIGNPGSGAALAAERFFTALGLWGEVIPVYLGYSMAAEELSRGRVEAVWEMVGFPSESLTELGRRARIRLLDVQAPALAGGLYNAYPFYRPMVIPAGTYPGQQAEVASYQDSALWVANSHMDPELVATALEKLFSNEGMEAMRRSHPSTRNLDQALGLFGVEIPLHPGAERFWKEQGQGKPPAP